VFIDQPFGDACNAGNLPCHQSRGILGRGLQCGLIAGSTCRYQTLAPLDPDLLHLGEDRFIRDVRRLQFQISAA
jgi:hypothetical protein